MQAMLLKEIGAMSGGRLALADIPKPKPAAGEVLIRVSACAVCHTELDEIEGRTPPPHLPVVPGHQVVGTVEAGDRAGQRVGVAWIYSACGSCAFCSSGRENLCAAFRATGRDADGGYAEYMTAPAAFVHPIPDVLSDVEAAPLLCAGAVGYRAVMLTGIHDGVPLGLYGFGASNHLVLKMALKMFPRSRIFVFTRNQQEQNRALMLGAAWSGAIRDDPPEPMAAAIDATPAWLPIVAAMRHLMPGGRLVVNAIRKEEADKGELLDLDFSSSLWLEKEIKSVANITRQDVRDFLRLAAEMEIRPEVEEYPLHEANQALLEIKQGRIHGAKVLRIG